MKKTGGLRILWLILAVLLLGAVYSVWAIFKPLPQLQPSASSVSTHVETGIASLEWPISGQAAVGIANSDILDTNGAQIPAPTASTAKIITALVVLKQKPLARGDQGPTLTLTAGDKAIYDSYVSTGGSVVPIQIGEQISEYQVLQAMLLPSANNMADSLAIWAFGSLQAYTVAANNYLDKQGLGTTHVGSDASGFSPTTVSTAHDLVRLGELTMQNPVLAEIVNQSNATGIPVASNIKNVNALLGTNGIVGIKTGNTDQAGGVFVSASHTTVNKKQITIVTALVGSPSLWQAMHESVPLIFSAQTNFKPATVVKAGDVLGSYHTPWGGNLTATAGKDLSLESWNGGTVTINTKLDSATAKTPKGAAVGQATIPASSWSDQVSIPIKIKNTASNPTIWWRLTHP